MADIFGGTQPPAWLTEVATRNAEHGQWGQLAGTLAGGLLNSFQRDKVPVMDPETGQPTGETKTGDRIGFLRGLTEARMNQADPMWKLKATQAQVNTLSTMAQTESAYALANERKQELRAWMQDVPSITPWLSMSPEQRKESPAPSVSSIKGMQAVQQRTIADDRYFNQKEQNRIREETSKIAQQKAQRWLDWQGVYANATPETRAAINQLGDRQWERGADGKIIGPSAEAEILYNNMETKDGKKPPFGIPKTEQQAWLESQKTAGRMKVEEAKGKRQEEVLKVRNEFARDMENLKQTGRVELAKAKSDAQLKMQKELVQIKADAKAKEMSAFYSQPKMYPQADGSVIYTYGKQMRVVPKPKVGDNAFLKSRLKEVDTKIGTLQKMSIADPNNDELRGRLLDAQLERVHLFDKRETRPATKQDLDQAGIQAQPEPDFQEEPTTQEEPSAQATPPAPSRFKILEVKTQ